MFEYYIWFLCFVSIYVSIFWMHVMYLEKPLPVKQLKKYPHVSFVVPAWNEEEGIVKTLRNLLACDYPNFEIIVVDDESSDATAAQVLSVKDARVRLVANKHKGIGKASAVNRGISVAKGAFVAVVDADCFVDKNSLRLMISHFSHEKVGAVMTPIKVKDPKTFFERMQRLEYLLTSFTRRMMSFINTIQVTPGALSLYRRSVLKKLGGFDEHNITEDMEMALKLHKAGYVVVMEPRIDTYTYVPNNLKDFWKQRTRWFSGFLHNTAKYRKITGKKDMMGLFQMPLNFLLIFIIIASVILFVYNVFQSLSLFFSRLLIYKWNLFSMIILPDTLKEFFFSLNLKLFFPLLLTILCGLYIYAKAHTYAREKWKFPLAICIYMSVYPFLRTAIWIAAMVQMVVPHKRRW